MTPTEATLAWMRARADTSLAMVAASGTKIGTWLLLGNAAALVLVLKTVIEGAACNDLLLSAARAFAVGMALAFVGWAVGYFTSIASVRMCDSAVNATSTFVTNGDYVDRLEAEYGANYRPGPLEEGIDAAGAELRKLARHTRWLLLPSILSVLLFAGSATAFGVGVMRPVAQTSLGLCVPRLAEATSVLTIKPTPTNRDGPVGGA